MSNLFDLFVAGGWAMVPISLASLIMVALILDNSWTIAKARRNLSWLWKFPDKTGQLLKRAPDNPVALYLAEAAEEKLTKLDEKRQLAGQLILAQERKISWLGTIAAIAPLLGLLGTVSGMINIFFTISRSMPQNPLAELAAGISEALVATAAGLIVAIISAIGQHFLLNANDNVAMDLESWLKRQDARPPEGEPLASPAK